MSDLEREKWDDRYESGDYRPRTWPSPFLEAWLPRLQPGRALDVACGAGRNAMLVAAAGHHVDAVDISSVAIAKAQSSADRRGLDVNWIVADLDDWRPAPSSYDLITVIRYVNRSLWPLLTNALTQNGWLFVEHHFATHEAVGGPTDPAFRLRPQELLQAFGMLRVVHFEEVIEIDRDGGRYALQRIAACNGDPGW